MISPAGSTFAVVCLGRVSEKGDPIASARYTLTRVSPQLDPEAVIESATVAGEAAVRYRIPLKVSRCLIEWKFAHAGWLYAAGPPGTGSIDSGARRSQTMRPWYLSLSPRSQGAEVQL